MDLLRARICRAATPHRRLLVFVVQLGGAAHIHNNIMAAADTPREGVASLQALTAAVAAAASEWHIAEAVRAAFAADPSLASTDALDEIIDAPCTPQVPFVCNTGNGEVMRFFLRAADNTVPHAVSCGMHAAYACNECRTRLCEYASLYGPAGNVLSERVKDLHSPLGALVRACGTRRLTDRMTVHAVWSARCLGDKTVHVRPGTSFDHVHIRVETGTTAQSDAKALQTRANALLRKYYGIVHKILDSFPTEGAPEALDRARAALNDTTYGKALLIGLKWLEGALRDDWAALDVVQRHAHVLTRLMRSTVVGAAPDYTITAVHQLNGTLLPIMLKTDTVESFKAMVDSTCKPTSYQRRVAPPSVGGMAQGAAHLEGYAMRFMTRERLRLYPNTHVPEAPSAPVQAPPKDLSAALHGFLQATLQDTAAAAASDEWGSNVTVGTVLQALLDGHAVCVEYKPVNVAALLESTLGDKLVVPFPWVYWNNATPALQTEDHKPVPKWVSL